MKPNFFIIGAPKSGTTAMAHYLSEHPKVFFSRIKELQFFSDDIPGSKNEMIPTDIDDYLSNFREADPNIHAIVAEGSTQYLRSKVAVPSITKNFKNPKFLIMLRNPVDAAQALHMEALYGFSEFEKDFKTAWYSSLKNEENLRAKESDKIFDHALYGRLLSYANQVEFVLQKVPVGSCMILKFDDFSANPQRCYEEVLSFLNLPLDGRASFDPVNSAHGHRWPFISSLILSPPSLFEVPIKFLRKKMIYHETSMTRSVKNYLNKKKEREPLDDEFKAYLKDFFHNDVRKLSTITGIDFNYWVS